MKTNIKSTAVTKKKSASLGGLDKLFIEELKDIYWAEKLLVKSLPTLAKAASDEELKKTIEGHLTETKEQVIRLEKIFEYCSVRAIGKKCEAMDGLVKECHEAIESFKAGPVRDAAIIISAQKIEHYEIAAYGSLYALANLLDKEASADLLNKTLEEEGDADEKLNKLAKHINRDAVSPTVKKEESNDMLDIMQSTGFPFTM